MSAEISVDASGRTAAMYRKPAWHGLGLVTGQKFTALEAATTTGLDFDVHEAVAGAMIDGVFVPYEVNGKPAMKVNYKVEYGEDGQRHVRTLGLVGKDRVSVPPLELWEFGDLLVGYIDGAHYEAMFALRNFHQIVGVINAGGVTLDPDGRNLKIGQFIVLRASYDGSWSLGAKWADVVPECANMMQMHLGTNYSEFTTRHTGDVQARMAEAQQALGIYRSYQEDWATEATRLVQKEMTAGKFDDWLEGLYFNYGKFVNDGVFTKEETDAEAMGLTRMLYESSPTTERIRGTAWGALNAATEYSDWYSMKGMKKETEPELVRVQTEKVFVRQMEGKQKYAKGFKQFAYEWTKEFVDA